jgi:hypothetical protein
MRCADRRHAARSTSLFGPFYAGTQIVQETITQVINPAMNGQSLTLFPGTSHDPESGEVLDLSQNIEFA